MATVSRDKLVPPEVQHIISVLDECVRKIDVLSLLPCELVHPECISQELGEPAVKSLGEHLQLSETFHLLEERAMDTRENLSLARDLQDSLRNFLRHMKPHKEAEMVKVALQGVGPIIEEDQKSVQELGAGLRELRGVVLERLMTMPREERECRRHGQEVRERNQHNLELLHSLELEETSATKHRDQTVRITINLFVFLSLSISRYIKTLITQTVV